MSAHLLPLQAFFRNLQRHPDFSLGLAEYETVLRVLEQAPDQYLTAQQTSTETTALFRLCKLLWLKPNQSEQLFKKLFEESHAEFSRWIQDEAKKIEKEQEQHGNNTNGSTTSIDLETSGESDSSVDPTKEKQPLPPIQPPPPQKEASTLPNELPPLYLNFQESGTGEKFGSQSLVDKSLLLVRNYVPFQQRQLVQIWRRLKDRSGESVATDEIDLDATLHKMNHEGYLLSPIYKQRAQSQAKLITLIDHKGSMVAFKHWADTIAQTAQEAGINNQVYYFQNVPQRYNTGEQLLYVYEDRGQIKHHALRPILTKQPNAAVLIISDAGTASGSYNMSRIEATAVFLTELYKHTLKVAWLNPMPENRWDGSSAYIIRELTDMFEASPEGLQKTLPLLKGKRQPRSPIVFPQLLTEL